MERAIKKNNQDPNAEKIVLDVMRYHGFRRNYQVAEYFNVTPQTLSGWIKSGEVPPKHLIKYKTEIANQLNLRNDNNTSISSFADRKIPLKNIKYFLKVNFSILFFLPLFSAITMTLYVFFFAEIIYTSKSKVLPISEDGSTSSSFSGFASQLGINIPINIGGKVPWDEIYPEIVKSGDLLQSLLTQDYQTKKYGRSNLEEILISEHKLQKYNSIDQTNRVVDKLRDMITVSKDRVSPIVEIKVTAFEPLFAANISKDLISKSSIIQRQLKTNRVKQKRLFIEERLNQVSKDMQKMERTLRVFRENNRNLSSSPSLQMKVQEMGREVDLQNSIYITLKTQYEKAKIDEVGRDDMVQQIDGPSIPTKLTSPKRTLSILLSLFFGFFTSLFVIYIRDNLS